MNAEDFKDHLVSHGHEKESLELEDDLGYIEQFQDKHEVTEQQLEEFFSPVEKDTKSEKMTADEKPFECKTCKKSFRRQIDLNNHGKGNSCDTSIKNQSELEENGDTKEHLTYDKIECQICLKRFAHLIFLEKHEKIHDRKKTLSV